MSPSPLNSEALSQSTEPDARTIRVIGPIRSPDECVLACPDCACRERINEHLARCGKTGEELAVVPTSIDPTSSDVS